jgi:hypothetical protein
MKANLIALLFTILTGLTLAQNGTLQGSVVDQNTGETIPGAKISIDGTDKITRTDFDGKFIIENVLVGTYSVTIKYPTYATKTVPDVIVKAGEATYLNVTINPAEKELTAARVKTKPKAESNNALLLAQKSSATVSDGISAESIRRTPDRSTSDVLKRISGASIQDNKFAIIRGLNDRYNAAYINGAPLPSSESDRKAFSFDIFPANMLDNLVIIKTATPDLPGEFAGGVIQVVTKSIPDKNFQSFAYSGGFNTITTGKNKLDYAGGKMDWLGIDDGNRAMPASIPNTSLFPVKNVDQAALAKTFKTDWGYKNTTFAPNTNFQYSFGWNKKIDTNRYFGIISAVNYNRTFVYTETLRNSYDNGTGDAKSLVTESYTDKNYSTQTLAGALTNLSYKWNSNNQLSFKNVYSINSEDRVIARQGEINPNSDPILSKSFVKWFTSNQIYTGQLIGDHFFEKHKIRLNWIGSFSYIKRDIPNLRRNVYSKNKNPQDPSDTTYTAAVENSTGPSYGGSMFYSSNKEGISSFKVDASMPILSTENFKNNLKVGVFVQHRYRDFTARQFGYAKYNSGPIHFKDSLLHLSNDQIFTEQNMGQIAPNVGGFKLIEGTKPSDSYNASSDLQAGFVMLDNKWKNNLRLIWGIRAENFKQNLYALRKKGDTLHINNKAVLDILPSANFIYSISEKQNLRLSASQTVNRPEYRELAPFAFYDFSTQFVVSGNDSLKRAKITNLDLRYEVFLGKGQLFSASFFHKKFNNPIEQVSRPDVEREIYYKNIASATNYGIEVEARLLASTLCMADSNKFLNDITLFSNIAIIRSSIDLSSVVGASARPLQGQSPYVFNAGVTYQNTEKEFSVTLNANKVGPRIFIVGNVNEPDIWENSRTFLDFQIAKTVYKKRLELKLNIQNILAQQQIFYQNSTTPSVVGNSFMNTILYGDKNYSKTYDPSKDDALWVSNFGRIFNFAVSYKF